MFTRKLALSGTVAGIVIAAVLVTASVAQQTGGPGASAAPQAQPAPQSQPAPQAQSAPQAQPSSPSQSNPAAQSQSRAPDLFADDDDDDDDDQDSGQDTRRDDQDQAGRDNDSRGRDSWAPRFGQGYGPRWRDERGWGGGEDRGRDWRGGPNWRDDRGYGFGGEERGYGPGGGEGRRFGFGDGRGPDMGGGSGGQGFAPGAHMHHGGMRMGCGPKAEMFVERMLRRLERVTQPTEQQRGAFDKLRQAAEQAHKKVQESCPTERPVSPTSRLALLEKRLTGVLEGVRIIRPAMDEYWGALSEEQKARYYARQGWAQRWRERMFEGRGMRNGDGRGWRDMRRRDDSGYGGRDRGGGASRENDRSDRMRGPRDTDGDGWPNQWGGRL